MAREIKFRGLVEGINVFMIGSLVISKTKLPIIITQTNQPAIQQTASHWNVNVPAFEVRPQTVGQFTGLHDKNGVEIYEGDVLKCYDNSALDPFWGLDKIHTGEVYYIDGCFSLKCLKSFEKVHGNVDKLIPSYVFLDKWLNAENTEIIGNIHQNPELLE